VPLQELRQHAHVRDRLVVARGHEQRQVVGEDHVGLSHARRAVCAALVAHVEVELRACDVAAAIAPRFPGSR
jgi:hypothetical protein